ncbi:MAG: D-Ala-D-Ala carboxypeptidase family metallohydrolase [Ahrensia sp.]
MFATRFMRAIGAAMAAGLMAATFVSPAGSASAQKPENPWHIITDFETDADHGYTMRQSPFDTMDDVQLAAVPRGNRVHYNAPSKCVPARLKAALTAVSAKYGPITVNSTYRSPAKNRKIGGKKSSWHLKCAAIDFRVHGSTKGLLSFLSKNKNVGGYKRYKSGFYHIDTGPKRTW